MASEGAGHDPSATRRHGVAGSRDWLRAWWAGLPEPLRSPAWPWIIAVLVILALLLGFVQVVRGAVRQGEALRTSAATRAEALWRCNSLGGPRLRARCLAELNAPPPLAEAGSTPPNTATVSIADVGR